MKPRAMYQTTSKIGMRRTVLAVAAGVGSALCGAVDAAALDKVKVTIAAASSNYAPYFNAIEEGYFKDEGLEAETIEAGGGIATPALLSGQVDFSTSAASAFSAILKGAQLKVVLTEADRPTYQLWSTTDNDKTIKSLKGKTVGIQTRGDTFEVWMRLVLKSHGMGGDDVSYTPLGFGSASRLAALKAGSLPAVVISSADVTELREAGALANGRMLEDAMKDDIRLPFNGVATSDALIKKNPDLVLHFIRAMIKGMRFMTAFREKTIATVMKYGHAERGPTEVDYDDVVRTLTQDGTVPPSVQRAEAEIRADLAKLPKEKIPPLESMFDYSFVEKANAGLKAQDWKPTP